MISDESLIDLNQQQDYLKHFSLTPQKTSDYSFVNLCGWAGEYQLTWRFTEPLIWLKQQLPQPKFWAPVGDWKNVSWPQVFKQIHLPATFTRVPEKLLDIWKDCGGLRLEITEERNNWDYIYEASDLINLRGNRYHKKKNLLNQFIKKYDYQYFSLNTERIDETLALQEDWCTWRNCESDETLASENKAIANVLRSYRLFDNICGGVIFVNQLVTAYTVAELFSDDMIIIHFEKGCPLYKGVYQAMNQLFLFHNADHRWVNREQDLGDSGLRKAKMSYHPSFFLKKYSVKVQEQK
ncbi:MAG: hypothetical protein OMM_03280 [Candidatus Magnetoglobus multicellularis str. Araruama]|uniref:Phosphatidylglycerol lysyltransferase C-terminal domain-containing protein n=1 Tax=Candidatus Magnetoglobus multicellularis str. Araruama TaxID=890399 RepID=A0A1V1P6H0_9BACT|nr:MAG: hypothetical protein OMM_03280 [Candidatus Magnetoglobus multicellularis str. Araruama]